MHADTTEIIKAGFLARNGLLTDADIEAASDLLARVADSDTETVRVLFADQHGIMRGKTIVGSALLSAFTTGIAMPSTLMLKDTSNRTVFPLWTEKDFIVPEALLRAGDLVMVPDPKTFRTLPWSAHSSWILCDVATKLGQPFPYDPRTILKKAIAKLDLKNISMRVGLEVEFHVFERLDSKLHHEDGTMPGASPETRLLAQGYQFLSENTYDQLEAIMDELRHSAQALGLPVRSMEVEMGPSQFEFTFEPDTPLVHADNMMMFRSMVKEVCARRDLHATFMCRPRVENGASSGWHLHQSLIDTDSGQNLFTPSEEGEITPTASNWIAGLLKHAAESCLLTTPTVNGYKRYQPFQLAPDRIQWGVDNRGSMIRGLMRPNDPASRIENRVADTTANPYYFFASQILGGLAGINGDLTAPAPIEASYDSEAPALPKSMIAAVEAFEGGTLFQTELGQDFVNYLSHIKRAEWDRYLMTVSEWEQREYFSLF